MVNKRQNYISNITHPLLNKNVRNILAISKDDIKMLYPNVNSIKADATFSKFEDFQGDLNCNFDVIILVETNLDKGTEMFYELAGYNSYHNNRDREGGSLVIYDICDNRRD